MQEKSNGHAPLHQRAATRPESSGAKHVYSVLEQGNDGGGDTKNLPPPPLKKNKKNLVYEIIYEIVSVLTGADPEQDLTGDSSPSS